MTARASSTPQRPLKARPRTTEIRIIGGALKRSKIIVAHERDLRPTPDRVRETLFNWLGQTLTGWRCLDLFAGTGVLGLEAASRGASEVILIEKSSTLGKRIEDNWAQLQKGCNHVVAVTVFTNDALTLAPTLLPGFDLIFVDPPYADAILYQKSLALAGQLLAPNGRVYLESDHQWEESVVSAFGLCVERYIKAGHVHAHLLTRL